MGLNKKGLKFIKPFFVEVKGYYLLNTAADAIRPTCEPERAAVEAAEVIPEVEIIQVLILGTVVIAIAPTKKVTITRPKDKIPFPANQAIFSMLSALLPSKVLYFSISTCMAYF